ncbi:hypothetical protein SAMN05421493_12010 [Pseudobutyrivibrio sp. 49]|uniref:hypothetical protein n=1 Tax=Pseudobutyrivibrio sp. 49 TaxID=1855344 RepID=UPI000886DE22|nr:hypothetical protein [Pseudobutyrivibrio sp. 49]SDI61686.1 hypothetical protein SAMN05421493_12010 [Pseudobutyrivibrio sp. 49]
MRERYKKCIALALCAAMFFEIQAMTVFASQTSYADGTDLFSFEAEEEESNEEQDKPDMEASEEDVIEELKLEEQELEEEKTEHFEISDGRLLNLKSKMAH